MSNPYSMANATKAIKASNWRPMKGKVFVTALEEGVRLTRGGILLPDDNAKITGIRARWGQVHSMGEGVEGIAVGDWILIKHGRWTQRITVSFDEGDVDLWGVEYPDSVELRAENDPRLQRTTLSAKIN